MPRSWWRRKAEEMNANMHTKNIEKHNLIHVRYNLIPLPQNRSSSASMLIANIIFGPLFFSDANLAKFKVKTLFPRKGNRGQE
jgi:hypothetical protein